MNKSRLHPRNRHQAVNGVAYDFATLCKVNPELTQYVGTNQAGNSTIDFAVSDAVKQLNKALLLHFYQLRFWDIPEQYLCPPIPGRADYIHYLADLLATHFNGDIPTGKNIKGLDIGTGANLIYPIIGSFEYKWSFVGSDIDPVSINCATQLCKVNPRLTKAIKLRSQNNPDQIFKGVINSTDKFAFTMCNPPFHKSAEEAQKGSQRKLNNLAATRKGKSESTDKLNFGGQANELWCDGGEVEFVCKMVRESSNYSQQVVWFSSLISKKDNLEIIQAELKKSKAKQIKIIDMGQGNKISRFIAWSFLTKEQQDEWFNSPA
ncbi:23S rRNA (adenine(1618)-N(6))-methyltransferase RlmF [Psychrosphaera sp. F3M07]|uniref:23S rRNA (adenine(1618)-N(6))-methyltransferase RlmF n=1 Tax=Psychrosphaera sp. F3M07 TaxID=2841560 RepID=UPI001C08B1AE|nr:23S rRNA (adenine(1618)-N(6))-methyltransferase RlmF [Psychrosphaera sp. F3M07]MBU2917279.1 23S rRNA (adenine(1618)-N(6))-methyltransferase RlmF [Psychrosphaera sp. F3M07]